MPKPSFTPGPWKVIEGPFISVVTEWTVMDDDDPSSATHHTIVHDCDHDGWVDLSVPRANARLIAASPDMLEALKAAIANSDANVGSLGRTPEAQAVYDQVAASIAKAESRT